MSETSREIQDDSNEGASVSPLNNNDTKRTIHSKKQKRRPKMTNCVRRLRNTCLFFGYTILVIHIFDVARFLYLNHTGKYLDTRLMLSVKFPLKMLNVGLIIVLLAGLHESKPQYARVYLIFCLIYLLFKATMVVYAVVLGHPPSIDIVYLCTIFAFTIITVVMLTMYFLLILRNYYTQIFEETKELPVNVMLDKTRRRISPTLIHGNK